VNWDPDTRTVTIQTGQPSGEQKDSSVTSEDPEGMPLRVYYREDKYYASYVPSFTLSLYTEDGKLLDTIEVGEQHYNDDDGQYEILFNHTNYAAGEKYRIRLEAKDSIITSLTMSSVDPFSFEKVVLAKEKDEYTFTVGSLEVYIDIDETQKTTRLLPNKWHPLEAVLRTDNTKAGLYIVNQKGEPIPNASVVVRLEGDQGVLRLKTNEKGLAVVDVSKLTDKFTVSVEGRRPVYEEGSSIDVDLSMLLVSRNSLTQILTYRLFFE